jgi:hypothetical protein
MKDPIDRRGFGRRCAALAALGVVAPVRFGWSEEPARVDEDAPQAKALGYRHDAATVDKTRFPNFVEGSHCANCALYQGGEEWGPCTLFAGQLVAAGGWCSAWAKKQA